MAYDEILAARIRAELDGTEGLTERKMFGGIGWMIGGHLACGAHSNGGLMVRCAKEDWERFLAEPGVDGMKRGGKNMSGWLLVDAALVDSDELFRRWVGRGQAYASSLPPKVK